MSMLCSSSVRRACGIRLSHLHSMIEHLYGWQYPMQRSMRDAGSLREITFTQHVCAVSDEKA